VNAFTASDRARAEGEAAGSIFRFKEILRDDPGASLSRGELRDVLRRFERLAALLTP
jgi:hypothetical protein